MPHPGRPCRSNAVLPNTLIAHTVGVLLQTTPPLALNAVVHENSKLERHNHCSESFADSCETPDSRPKSLPHGEKRCVEWREAIAVYANVMSWALEDTKLNRTTPPL